MLYLEQAVDQAAEMRKQEELTDFIKKQQERIVYPGDFRAYSSLDATGYMDYWGKIGGLFEEIDANIKMGKNFYSVPPAIHFQVNQLVLLDKKPARVLQRFIPRFLYGDRSDNKTIFALGDDHPVSPDVSYFLILEVGKQSFDGIRMLERIKKSGGAVADYVGWFGMKYDRNRNYCPIVSGRLGHIDTFVKDSVNGFEPDVNPKFYTLPCERAYAVGSYLSHIYTSTYPLSPDLYDPSAYVHAVDSVS